MEVEIKETQKHTTEPEQLKAKNVLDSRLNINSSFYNEGNQNANRGSELPGAAALRSRSPAETRLLVLPVREPLGCPTYALDHSPSLTPLIPTTLKISPGALAQLLP